MINSLLKNRFINSAIIDNNVGKIELYGDVYDEIPIDWWTGKPITDVAITLKDFKESLEKVKSCDSLEIHLNSYGGDATVGLTIRNLLKATQKHTTCIIDGIAASAAFTIAAGCDEVHVYKGSILMCHKVMSLLVGYYNNDNLQEIINGNEAYDNAAAAVYADKTGMTTMQCLNLMKKVTWMTGEQAIQYGFADKLLEDPNKSDALPVNLEVVNKNKLKVNGIEHTISGGIPDDFLHSINLQQNKGGIKNMPKSRSENFFNHVANFFKNENTNVDEESNDLNDNQNENSEEDAQNVNENNNNELKTENESQVSVETQIQNAVKAERDRIQGIQEIASSIDDDLVQEALYGDKACDAKELALRSLHREAEKNQKALTNLNADANTSRANDVASEPANTLSYSEDAEREQAVRSMNAKISKEGK